MATAVISRNIWAEIDRTKPPVAIELDRDARDEAEWFSKAIESFTIRFTAESPFRNKEFHVPLGGSVCSGPPTSSALKGGHYKYEVLDSNNITVHSNEIVIKP
jgi:hypothetical protein